MNETILNLPKELINSNTLIAKVESNNFYPMYLKNDYLIFDKFFDVELLEANQTIIILDTETMLWNIYLYNGAGAGYIPNTNQVVELNDTNILIGVGTQIVRNINKAILCNN